MVGNCCVHGMMGVEGRCNDEDHENLYGALETRIKLEGDLNGHIVLMEPMKETVNRNGQ